MVSTAQSIPSEIILHIFRHLSQPSDLRHCAFTCKTWSPHALELLWYKPNFDRPNSWTSFSNVLHDTQPLFPYTIYMRRINLSMLASEVSDSDLTAFSQCERLERVTFAGCSKLSDEGVLAFLGKQPRRHLVSIDLSDVTNVSDVSIKRIALTCPNLQGLNLSMYKDGTREFENITDDSVVVLAEHCTSLRRIKLNNCIKVTDVSAIMLAERCPALLEIDLMNCNITNESLYVVFYRSRELRELRLNNCTSLDDLAFTDSSLAKAPPAPPAPPPLPTPPPLPSAITTAPYYDQLRILDLTSVFLLTDDTVRLIVSVAPKIRNLILNKCYSITDDSVRAICNLGRYLHFLHLGHCTQLTDFSIVRLARQCTRIRYLDLANCALLTDRSVFELATLPKLKRIGLVKCVNITDQAIYSLTSHIRIAHSLERVHLSYCARLTVPAIMRLVNFCAKLTHLSLTQVPAFVRPDLQQFRRAPPKEFTPQQRSGFSVFSGKGVRDLRTYLNTTASSGDLQNNTHPPPLQAPDAAETMVAATAATAAATTVAVTAVVVGRGGAADATPPITVVNMEDVGLPLSAMLTAETENEDIDLPLVEMPIAAMENEDIDLL